MLVLPPTQGTSVHDTVVNAEKTKKGTATQRREA